MAHGQFTFSVQIQHSFGDDHPPQATGTICTYSHPNDDLIKYTYIVLDVLTFDDLF